MDGSWQCELEDKDFDFICGGNDADSMMWENVHVFRKGKKEDVLSAMEKTGEDLIEEEAELSRQRREAKEKTPGQLKKPDLPEYHPKVKPGA